MAFLATIYNAYREVPKKYQKYLLQNCCGYNSYTYIPYLYFYLFPPICEREKLKIKFLFALMGFIAFTVHRHLNLSSVFLFISNLSQNHLLFQKRRRQKQIGSKQTHTSYQTKLRNKTWQNMPMQLNVITCAYVFPVGGGVWVEWGSDWARLATLLARDQYQPVREAVKIKNGKTWEFFPTSDDPPSP